MTEIEQAVDGSDTGAPTQRPAAPGIPAWPGHTAWRDGDLLVVAKETEPPERCLKCNAPAGGKPIKKALSWSSVDAPSGGHAPQGPVGCLLGLFELMGIAACVATMRTARIQLRLCDAHRDEVRRFRRVAWGGSVAGGLMVLAASLAAIWIHGQSLGQTAVNVATAVFCIGALLAVFSIAYAAKKCALITVRKIDEGFVWLEGGGPEYLGSLPDFRDLPPSAITEINARPPRRWTSGSPCPCSRAWSSARCSRSWWLCWRARCMGSWWPCSGARGMGHTFG
jgi:hypothetical protein